MSRNRSNLLHSSYSKLTNKQSNVLKLRNWISVKIIHFNASIYFRCFPFTLIFFWLNRFETILLVYQTIFQSKFTCYSIGNCNCITKSLNSPQNIYLEWISSVISFVNEMTRNQNIFILLMSVLISKHRI